MWLVAVLCGLVSACATPTFSVKSDPLQADVFFQVPGTNEKKPIGKTPLTMPMAEFRQLIGADVSSGQYFPITVEKQGYVTETFQIPASRFGTFVTELDVKMKESKLAQEEKTAKVTIDRLFLAQRFALTNQFERAQAELDKILADFPTLARALSMRASIFYAQKNYTESLKWYEEAIKADPQMDDAIKMAAKVRLLQSGRAPAAEAAKGTAQ
jgi:tetratricopeptide (TPR) repeat protein